jgi:hypothetical protein
METVENMWLTALFFDADVACESKVIGVRHTRVMQSESHFFRKSSHSFDS